MPTIKEQFLEAYNNITRAGSREFLAWLESTDFFTAPASTRFHLSREGGLAEHSLHVFQRLRELCDAEMGRDPMFAVSAESIAIIGLLHDVCKTNFYKIDFRNAKNAAGVWEKVPYYTVGDDFPMGHGEKSLYLISRYMKLTDEEAMAIRWHMGFSDNTFRGGDQSVGNAFDKYPLAVFAHVADVLAAHVDEAKS